MMYIYPFSEKVMVEERRELPGVKPTSSGRWWLRNAFWRQLGPDVHDHDRARRAAAARSSIACARSTIT